MSATPSTINHPAVTKKLGGSFRLVSGCVDRIACYFVRRAAVASLRELDDQALSDIGIARSQIEAAVHGFVTVSKRGRV